MGIVKQKLVCDNILSASQAEKLLGGSQEVKRHESM
jgi:hypothetical protein